VSHASKPCSGVFRGQNVQECFSLDILFLENETSMPPQNIGYQSHDVTVPSPKTMETLSTWLFKPKNLKINRSPVRNYLLRVAVTRVCS
jgi:hypothetical protein